MANAASNSPLLGKDHQSQPAYYPAVSYDGRHLYYVERTSVVHDRQPRFWRRFCHFLSITLLFTLALRYFDIHPLRFLEGGTGPTSSDIMDSDFPGMPSLDFQSPGVEWACVSGDLWDFDSSSDHPGDNGMLKATTAFELHADADLFTFYSRGMYSYGHVDIVASDEASDRIKVDVVAGYYDRHALDRAKACRFRTDEAEEGVAILTPHHGPPHRHHRDNVRFDITIRIPPESAALRHIPSFHSYFSLFSQTMHNLTNVVDFGKAGLFSTNQKVFVMDIRARDLTIHTTNAPVIGSFNTSSSLVLSTSNAPVQVDVTAFNLDNINDITLHTSNGPMMANLSLIASPASTTPGSFNVTATTANSRLQVTYLTSPPDSILNARMATTNSPAYARLDTAFEGTFTAASTLFSPVITPIEDAEDPAGRNRERRVNMEFVVKGVARGNVGWEPLEHERGQPGSVTVMTTNSPVHLTL